MSHSPILELILRKYVGKEKALRFLQLRKQLKLSPTSRPLKSAYQNQRTKEAPALKEAKRRALQAISVEEKSNTTKHDISQATNSTDESLRMQELKSEVKALELFLKFWFLFYCFKMCQRVKWIFTVFVCSSWHRFFFMDALTSIKRLLACVSQFPRSAKYYYFSLSIARSRYSCCK